MQNSIREVLGPNGEVLTKRDTFKQEADHFFKYFLTHEPEDFTGMSIESLQDILKFRCTDANREFLTKEVSKEEIKKVLFSMPSNKSPGPDGLTSEFFKAAWPIIGNDFIAAIKSFFIK